MLWQSAAGYYVIGRHHKLQMPARHGDRLPDVILHRTDNFLHDDRGRLPSTTVTTAERIRGLNDAFRRTFVGGMIMITAGVEALPVEQRRSLLEKVRAFDVFTDDNDPHGEHDFGAVDEGGVRCFWKIDYYDRATEMGSPDPADPAVTTRVLTIMRADEY